MDYKKGKFAIKKIVFLLLCFFYCSYAYATDSLYDRVVVFVGVEAITQNELILSFNQLKGERDLAGGDSGISAKEKAAYLKDLIYELLLLSDAKQKKITISENEVDKAVSDFQAANQLNTNRLETLLQGWGMDLEYFKNQLRRKKINEEVLRLQVYAKIVVNEAELKQTYQKKYSDKNTYYSVRHLLKKQTTPETVAELKKIRKEAILNNNFGKLILQYSEDPFVKQNNGKLPDFRRQDMLAEFSDAVIKLKVDEISQPIKIQSGYHLIQLLNTTKKSAVSFEEVRSTIYKEIYQKKYQTSLNNYIKKLKKQYQVVFNDLELKILLEQNGFLFS